MNWTESDLAAYQARRSAGVHPIERKAITDHFVEPTKKVTGRQPNKTELEYSRMLELEFPGCEISYEGMTFRLNGGSRYTPDWIVKTPNGELLCCEVKNAAYKHASYGRSRLAYNYCKIEWPMMKWRWCEKTKDGWNIL